MSSEELISILRRVFNLEHPFIVYILSIHNVLNIMERSHLIHIIKLFLMILIDPIIRFKLKEISSILFLFILTSIEIPNKLINNLFSIF